MKYEQNSQVNDWQVDPKKAIAQWESIKKVVSGLGVQVTMLQPQPDVPDMVFTADLGYAVDPEVSKKTVILSNFKYPQRKAETKYHEALFQQLGYKVVRIPPHVNFEVNYYETDRYYFLSYGIRNDKKGIDILKDYFEKPIVVLKMIDPRFYHLSCAFSVLDDQTAMFYPEAFDRESIQKINEVFPRLIRLRKGEALDLLANSTVINHTIITPTLSERIRRQFRIYKLSWKEFNVSEYKKAGGAVFCMLFNLEKLHI